MAETAALRYMLPWLAADVEHAQRVLGDSYWTYGLPGNVSSLETVIRYAHAQGLIDSPLAAADLFAPETLTDTVI
jgi:4,5-dihydroxyphthalate decarboxylase